MTRTYQDVLRLALPFLAVAQALAGQLHALTGLGVSIPERSAQSETAAIPAGYAFAIWGLIFLWSFAFSIYQLLPARRGSPVVERLRGPAAAAFAMNVVWQLNAQLNSLEWVSFALIVVLLGAGLAAVVTLARYPVAVEGQDRWLAAAPLHVLAGWLSVAVFAHLSSTLQLTGGLGLGLPATARDATLVLCAAAAGSAVAPRARAEVRQAYALTVAWGLAGVVVANVVRAPDPTVAGAALAGIAAVLGAVAWASREHRRDRRAEGAA